MPARNSLILFYRWDMIDGRENVDWSWGLFFLELKIANFGVLAFVVIYTHSLFVWVPFCFVFLAQWRFWGKAKPWNLHLGDLCADNDGRWMDMERLWTNCHVIAWAVWWWLRILLLKSCAKREWILFVWCVSDVEILEHYAINPIGSQIESLTKPRLGRLITICLFIFPS